MADSNDDALFAGVVFAVIPGGNLEEGTFKQDVKTRSSGVRLLHEHC